MHIIIIIFVFVGLCLGLNSGRIITDKMMGTSSSSSSPSPEEEKQPKMSRSAPILSVNPEFLIEAENFWHDWLEPADPESVPATTQQFEPDTLSPPPSTFVTPNLSEINATKVTLQEDLVHQQNSTETPTNLTEILENFADNSTETMNNSEEVSEITESSDEKNLLDTSATLLKTPQEQQVYITKLFAALSKEIVNITGQPPPLGSSSSPSSSTSSQPIALDGVYKAAASQLTPSDRALFENLVILSLLKTTATLPPTRPYEMPVSPTKNNLAETEEEEDAPILKSSHPDVTAVLKQVSLLTGETEENEEEKALAIESSPAFGRLVYILKNLYQKAAAPQSPATESEAKIETVATNQVSIMMTNETENNLERSDTTTTMTTTGAEMTTEKLTQLSSDPNTSRAIVLDLLLKIGKLRSQIPTTTTTDSPSKDEIIGNLVDDAEDDKVSTTMEPVLTTTSNPSIEKAKRLKKLLIYLILSKNFTMATTTVSST